ncbi:MAG: hypothetical protein VX114_04425 [Chloroflexota bacterium]|nr:hypothetical protein [Chloroflexota bacterium]|tara:strand:+ start:1730 stop:2368 length:639 start_codon:yes stop_codon:yes gene_type:complete
MNLLVSSGHKDIENLLNQIDNHEVKIVNEITEKNISKADCLLILSSLENCSSTEEFNLKIQGIYNTLALSVEQGVNKVIMISSLEILDYKKSYTVTENWKPKPKKDMYNLSLNLSEIVFKEFGRTFPFQKILLRVGFPINDKLNNNLNCFTSKKDFVITISKILKTNFKNQFEVFHVQSECDHQRYLTNKLNDLERLSSSIDDYYYYPRKKL